MSTVWIIAAVMLTAAAVMEARLLASVPAAPALSAMVPGLVPLSVYAQVKVTCPPPGMVCGVKVVGVEAFAPPVAVSVGGRGDGSTDEAVACPRFLTTITALNGCPRDSVVGMVKLDTCRRAGSCTWARLVEVGLAKTSLPVTPSVPLAPAESCREPGPVPFSW